MMVIKQSVLTDTFDWKTGVRQVNSALDNRSKIVYDQLNVMNSIFEIQKQYADFNMYGGELGVYR